MAEFVGYFQDLVRQALHGNEFFAGGALLTVLGFALAAARHLPRAALRLLRRRFLVTVELRRDETRYWFTWWMAEMGHTRRTRNLLPRTSIPSEEKGPSIDFQPGYGFHLIRHGGRFYVVERRLEKPEGGGGGGLADLLTEEVVTITTWSRSTERIRGLIEEVSRFAYDKLERRQHTFVNDAHGGWSRINQDVRRDLDSVVLPPGLQESVVRDVERFFARRDWYRRRAVPWRRGHLLTGPPGTGKTSLVRGLATHFALRLHVLNLTDEDMTDRGILRALSSVEGRALVLLEDVDALVEGRQVREGLRWSFTGLINAIDGALSSEGRLLVVTSNRPEVLDPALVRPGRIDRVFHLDYACATQARELFLRFFPGEEELAAEFGEAIEERGRVPVSAIQGHLIIHSDAAVEALAAVDEVESSTTTDGSLTSVLATGPSAPMAAPAAIREGRARHR